MLYLIEKIAFYKLNNCCNINKTHYRLAAFRPPQCGGRKRRKQNIDKVNKVL